MINRQKVPSFPEPLKDKELWKGEGDCFFLESEQDPDEEVSAYSTARFGFSSVESTCQAILQDSARGVWRFRNSNLKPPVTRIPRG